MAIDMGGYFDPPSYDSEDYDRYLDATTDRQHVLRYVDEIIAADLGIGMPRGAFMTAVRGHLRAALVAVLMDLDQEARNALLVEQQIVPTFERWNDRGPAEKVDRDEHAND